MNRRGFLEAVAGAIAAPAVVRAESLMKLWVPRDPATWVGIDLASNPDVVAIWSRALFADTHRNSLAWFAARLDQLAFEHLCSHPAPGAIGAQREKEVPRGCEIEVQERLALEDRARDRAEEGEATTGHPGESIALRRERRRVLTLGTSAKRMDGPASVGLFLT